MGLGLGEIVVLGVLLLIAVWSIAPVVGIIRAINRKARGGHSAAAPILAGISLGFLVCFWLLGSLARRPSGVSYFSFLQMGAHILWLVLAIQANRAANRKAI